MIPVDDFVPLSNESVIPFQAMAQLLRLRSRSQLHQFRKLANILNKGIVVIRDEPVEHVAERVKLFSAVWVLHAVVVNVHLEVA